MAGYGGLSFKNLMGSGRVVVFDEGGQDTTEVVFVEDQELVQTLFAHGAHPAFGEGIGVGCVDQAYTWR